MTDQRSAATAPGLGVRPWRDGLDEEIEADQEYEQQGCSCSGGDSCGGFGPCGWETK